MKHKKMLVGILALLSVSALVAQVLAVNSEFTISGDTITKYTGSDAIVQCPDTAPDGTDILHIGERAFINQLSLTSITLPSKLQTIGPYAFYGARLTSISIPDSLTVIEDWALCVNSNAGLSSLDLKNVETLGKNALSCGKFSSIDLSGCTSIGSNALNSGQLTSIIFPTAENVFYGEGIFRNNKLTTITVPSNMTHIPASTFRENLLTDVVLPEGAVIGAAAFNDNEFPADKAFFYERAGSTKLTSYGGAQRENIVIPDGTTEIGDEAMTSNSIISCTIPSTVTSIGVNAFMANQLTTISIPKSVTNIGANAFLWNPALKTIYMEGRQDLEGMTLGDSWNGTAEIVFGSGTIEPDEPEPTPTPDDTKADVTISGSISAATIDIDVPLSTTFHLDQDLNFSAPKIVIHNNSPIPIKVTGVSMCAKSNSPKVINHDTYTDDRWDNLSAYETHAGIALGLLTDNSASDVRLEVVGGPQWFGDQDKGNSNLYLGTIKAATASLPSPKLTLDLWAKYGRVWEDTTQIDYILSLAFEAE